MQIFKCKRQADDYGTFSSFCTKSQGESLLSYADLLFNNATIDTVYAWLYAIKTCVFNLFRVLINKRDGAKHRYSGDLLSFAL